MEGLKVTLFVLFALGLGSVVHGMTGFGFALVTMGFMSMFFTVKESTLIVLALNAVFLIPMIIKYRRHIRPRAIMYISCSAIVGSTVGFYILHHFGEADWMTKWLGIMLIFMVPMLYLERRNSRLKSSVSWISRPIPIVLVGFVGGFVGAVFAVGGPFFVMYFLMRFTEKREYNVNLQILFLILIMLTLLLHISSGGVNDTVYYHLLIGAPVVMLGMFVGMKWFERMNRQWIEKFVYVIVLLAGCQLLLFS